MRTGLIGRPFGNSVAPAPPDATVDLSTAEIATLAGAVAARRGYPEDSHDMIGPRV